MPDSTPPEGKPLGDSVPKNFQPATGGYYAPDGTWRPRHIGMLKSFNHRNGFGFIQCRETHDLYKQDVFIHKNFVPNYIQVGQWVEFVANLSTKGQPQASNVSWLAQKSGSDEAPKDSKIFSAPKDSKVYSGTLKSFSTRSGYGFASCSEIFAETQRDVYVHKVELPPGGDWRVGQELDFEVTQNLTGQPQAKNVVWK